VTEVWYQRGRASRCACLLRPEMVARGNTQREKRCKDDKCQGRLSCLRGNACPRSLRLIRATGRGLRVGS
jgi:hypothetical protein